MGKKTWAIGFFTILLVSAIVSHRAQSSLPQLSYKIPEPKLWLKQNDVEISIVGPAHYYFNGTEDIDLNIVPIDDDLLSSLNERGEKNFVDDIMRGKNKINEMFAAEQTNLVSFKTLPIPKTGESETQKVTDQAGGEGKLLEIRTTQMIGNEEHYILERYFIYPKQAINFQLRFKKSSDQTKVKQAEKLFSQITPQVRKSKTK